MYSLINLVITMVMMNRNLEQLSDDKKAIISSLHKYFNEYNLKNFKAMESKKPFSNDFLY
jgi:hypothetical protein